MSRNQCLARKYVTREEDKDSDNEEADDSRSNGEELLNIDWDTDAVSSDFDLMSLKTGGGRCCAERQVIADVVVTSRGTMAVQSAAHRLHVDAEHSADSGLPPTSGGAKPPTKDACAVWVSHGAMMNVRGPPQAVEMAAAEQWQCRTRRRCSRPVRCCTQRMARCWGHSPCPSVATGRWYPWYGPRIASWSTSWYLMQVHAQHAWDAVHKAARLWNPHEGRHTRMRRDDACSWWCGTGDAKRSKQAHHAAGSSARRRS